jgi:RHS repeat-associated protein
MFARYYNSVTGRFLSPDWSAKAQPVLYAKLDDPQSLNLYSYVRNNPVGLTDNDGHEIIYANGLQNAQLVRDTVSAMLADPHTSGSLSGYVGANSPNLTTLAFVLLSGRGVSHEAGHAQGTSAP